MKNLTFLALVCVVCGCRHNEFDVTPEQVAKKTGAPHSVSFQSGSNHKPAPGELPPGSFEVKKGDRLPDGTISDGTEKIVMGPTSASGDDSDVETQGSKTKSDQ